MGEDKELKVGMLTKRAQQKKSISRTNFKERVFVLTQTHLAYYEGNLQVPVVVSTSSFSVVSHNRKLSVIQMYFMMSLWLQIFRRELFQGLQSLSSLQKSNGDANLRQVFNYWMLFN